MKVITYSLKDSSDSSDNYYSSIAIFTEKVIEKAYEDIGTLITEYEAYIKASGSLPVSSSCELIVEALSLGVFWKVYGDIVLCLNPIYRKALSIISKKRRKNYFIKNGLDIIKGVMITFSLLHPLRHKTKHAVPTLEQVKVLLLWLEAFGEFEQEIIRLHRWVDYISSRNIAINSTPLKDLIKYSDWFEVEGQKYLGKYTQNVDAFLMEKALKYRWREDIIFCLRKPIEYHLNMIGAEILSREYRTEFFASLKKKVLLPVCMRSRSAGKCMATTGPLGLICARCTPGCMVNTITILGNKNGYEVYIIPHESSAFSGNDKSGIIGVSCVTRLIEGGWKAKELGLPPQCVVLDYCGCKKHWDDNGIPTTLNISELNKILTGTISKPRENNLTKMRNL